MELTTTLEKLNRVDSEILIIQCDGSYFGVPAGQVSEVVRAVAVSPLPQMPVVMLGLINLRGELVPVIDTRVMLGLAGVPVHHSHQFVIVRAWEGLVALHVDQAIDLIRVEAGSDDSTVKTEMGIVPILSPEILISDDHARFIRSAIETSATSSSADESNQ